jgi:hypothetical protein
MDIGAKRRELLRAGACLGGLGLAAGILPARGACSGLNFVFEARLQMPGNVLLSTTGSRISFAA